MMDDYEARLHRKLGREPSGTSVTSMSSRSSGSSMPKAIDDFEERLKRKLRSEADNNRGSTAQGSVYSSRSERTMGRKPRKPRAGQMLSASMPPIKAGAGREDENGQQAVEEERTSRQGEAGKKKADKHKRRSTREKATMAGEGDAAAAQPSTSVTLEECLGVTHVDFGDVFARLRQFQEEHEGNLAVPVSHPAFLPLMHALSSAGIEEALHQTWNYQFAGLKAFQRENGDCLVPACNPTLGTWMRVQREEYRRYEEGNKASALTKKQYHKLKDMGFDAFVRWVESGEEAKVAESEQVERHSTTPTEAEDKANEDASTESPAHSAKSVLLDEKIQKKLSTGREAPKDESDEAQTKKQSNHVKFMERGLWAHASSKTKERKGTSKPKPSTKEAVAKELQQKRMLRASLTKKKVQAIEMHTGSKEEDGDGPQDRGTPSSRPISATSDVVPDAPSPPMPTNDNNVDDWGDLAAVLAIAAEQSVAELAIGAAHRQTTAQRRTTNRREDWRQFAKSVKSVRGDFG